MPPPGSHTAAYVILIALLAALVSLVVVTIVAGEAAAAGVRLPDVVIGLVGGLAGVSVGGRPPLP